VLHGVVCAAWCATVGAACAAARNHHVPAVCEAPHECAAAQALSVLLYGTVQVPAFLGDTEDPQASKHPRLPWLGCSSVASCLPSSRLASCLPSSPAFDVLASAVNGIQPHPRKHSRCAAAVQQPTPPPHTHTLAAVQAALVGAVACLTACLAYCGYSVLSPELQKRRIDAARKSRFKAYALRVCHTAPMPCLAWHCRAPAKLDQFALPQSACASAYVTLSI